MLISMVSNPLQVVLLFLTVLFCCWHCSFVAVHAAVDVVYVVVIVVVVVSVGGGSVQCIFVSTQRERERGDFYLTVILFEKIHSSHLAVE